MGRTLWIVTRKHPPSVGGMEALSYHLVDAMCRLRPVTVVSFGGGRIGLGWFLPYAAGRVVAGLVSRQIVALHLGDPALGFLAIVARRFGVPVMATVHGLDITWPNRLYQAYLRRFFIGRCDRYVCISTYVRDLLRVRGVPEEAIEVIPVGIAAPPPCGETLAVEGDPVIAYVGRLVPRKGVAWFVREVMPEVCRRFARLILVVAGAGPERATIAAAAHAAGIESRVRMVGRMPESAKWSLYARCDVVVMPNVPIAGDVEGFGLVALEASSMGKPVVASDLEGLRDSVVNEVNGWRFPAENAAAWIAGLTDVLGDREVLASTGRRAREFANQFDWQAIGGRYAALVDRIATK